MSSSTSTQVYATNENDSQRRTAKKRKHEEERLQEKQLEKEDEPNPNLNPHAFQNSSTHYNTLNFTRVLKDDFPELKYRSRKHDEDRSTVHYGQRKLHLSEIEFLTNFSKEIDDLQQKIVLIYAGAAPGTHISKLSSMFPFINFVLVDPANFIVKETDRIEIIQECFTNEMALEMSDKYKDDIILFISDIRVFGPGNSKDKKHLWSLIFLPRLT